MTISYRLVRPGVSPDLELNDVQRQIAAHRKGVLVVLGGARVGKTTALIHAAIQALAADVPQVMFFTGSRRSAGEVRALVGARVPDLVARLEVATFHGWSQRAIMRCEDSEPEPRVVSAARQDGFVRQILAGQPDDAWPPPLRLAKPTRRFATQIRETIAELQRARLTPAHVRSTGVAQGRDDWVSLARFYQEYLDILGLAGLMDYPELLIRAHHLVRDPTTLALVRDTGALIIVDDAEDIDDLQGDLLASLVDHSTPVIMAVDPDRQVFGFRGARPQASWSVVEEVSRQGISTDVVTLTSGHGVPSAVVDACGALRDSIVLPPGVPTAALASYRAGVGDRSGAVEKIIFRDGDVEADHIARLLHTEHCRRGIAYQDMAIIVRRRSDFARYTMACATAGVPVVVSGDEIQLNQEQVVMRLLACLRVVRDGVGARAMDLREVIASPLAGDPGGESGRDRRCGLALTEESEQPNADGDSRVAWVFSEDTDLPLSGLRSVVRAGRARLSGSVADVLWAIWQTSSWQDGLLREAEAGVLRANRDLDAVIALFALAGQFADLEAGLGISALDSAVAFQEIPDNLPRSFLATAAVRLTTAHRAKPMSWPLVVVADVNDREWPGPGPGSALVSTQGLIDDVIASPNPLDQVERDRIAAERRLLVTACSAARERLILTAVDDEDVSPSRFFTQIIAGLTEEVGGSGEPEVSRPGIVGRLRVVASDESAHPSLRQAACDRLAALSLDPRFEAADPTRWWSVGALSGVDNPPGALRSPGAAVVLSASQVQSLLECPRRWYLARRAGGEAPSSASAAVGSLIHRVVQAEDADLAQMIEALGQGWGQVRFPATWMRTSEWEAGVAALNRYWAYRFATGRQIVASEMSFSVQVDVGTPVIVQGRIDRVEQDTSGGLWIVDYKTGRSTPTVAQARANIQLGLYQLAGSQGALGEDAVIAGAELVYLRHEGAKGSALPKVFVQESITSCPHLSKEAPLPVAGWPPLGGLGDQWDYPTWVHHEVALASAILAHARYPGVGGAHCRGCAFHAGCPLRDNQEGEL